ncbi:MAG: carbon storage regulator [Aureliella sp.]
MLVLSRKEGEKLVIGDNITVVVSRVAGNRVTLGIEAPSDVRIVRGELKAQEKEAGKAEVKKVVPMRRAATVTIEVESLALDKQAM